MACAGDANPVAVNRPGSIRSGPMAGLPPVATEDAFTAVCQDEAALRPGIERLCQQLGVGVSELTRYAAGSRPVYAAGDLVLKLFPPVDTIEWRGEGGVLGAVGGRRAVAAPP